MGKQDPQQLPTLGRIVHVRLWDGDKWAPALVNESESGVEGFRCVVFVPRGGTQEHFFAVEEEVAEGDQRRGWRWPPLVPARVTPAVP